MHWPKKLSALLFALGLGAAPGVRGELRELRTDRPDVTEGPFTVDAGHWQVELDFANYGRDAPDGERTTEWGALPFNLRRGITPDFELGLFAEPFLHVNVDPPAGSPVRRSGAGDLTLRAKVNFWGNDGGRSAFGLIVDCKLPTAGRGLGNGKLEGALTLPVNWELSDGWELGAMTRLNAAYGDRDHYRAVWDNTVTLGHDLTANTGAYLEFTSSAGAGPLATTLDSGVTWKLDANTQLDAGLNLGVSRAAPDWHVFTGLSRRF